MANKGLVKETNILYFIDKNWNKINEKNERMTGDCSNIFGNCSRLSGDCSGLSGNCSGLKGNCTGIKGCCTGIYGNLDELRITEKERMDGISIDDLVKK